MASWQKYSTEHIYKTILTEERRGNLHICAVKHNQLLQLYYHSCALSSYTPPNSSTAVFYDLCVQLYLQIQV